MDGSRIAFVIRSLPKTPLITAWMTETTMRSRMIALVRAHRLAVSMELGGAFQETALLTLATLSLPISSDRQERERAAPLRSATRDDRSIGPAPGRRPVARSQLDHRQRRQRRRSAPSLGP